MAQYAKSLTATPSLPALKLVCAVCLLSMQLEACSTQTVDPPGLDASARSARFEEPAPSTTATRSISNGLYTRGQASRGERRFQQLCADCHRTGEITRSWFGGTVHQTAGDLFDVISKTMPEGNPGSLEANEYADILAFLLSYNDYPAGDDELPADPPLLETVSIPAP